MNEVTCLKRPLLIGLYKDYVYPCLPINIDILVLVIGTASSRSSWASWSHGKKCLLEIIAVMLYTLELFLLYVHRLPLWLLPLHGVYHNHYYNCIVWDITGPYENVLFLRFFSRHDIAEILLSWCWTPINQSFSPVAIWSFREKIYWYEILGL